MQSNNDGKHCFKNISKSSQSHKMTDREVIFLKTQKYKIVHCKNLGKREQNNQSTKQVLVFIKCVRLSS